MKTTLRCAGTVLAVLVVFFTSSQGQTLKADYQFQGNMNSSVGNVPPITNLVAAGNGQNSFTVDQVDGYTRQVLNFPTNNGVALNDLTAIVPNTLNATVVVLFKFTAVSGTRRIIDYSGGTEADNGEFLLNGLMFDEPAGHAPTDAGTYFQVILVRGTGGVVSVYRDNVIAYSFPDGGSPLSAGLRFFQDWAGANPVLASSGSIARLRIFDGPLTLQQIRQLDRVPGNPTGPMPILFYSGRNGTTELFRMNADGTSQARLTNNEVGEIGAKFSPNGQKIVYQRRETSTDPWQIWTANADGSGQTRLTNTSTVDKYPSWRPDGQKILFSRCSGSCDLFLMNPDGTGQAPIASTATDEDNATFTPNGSKLVFACSDANQQNYQLCVSNADGTNRQAITNTTTPVLHTFPNVSPDGTKIVYIRNSGPNDVRIVTVNINGSNPVVWPQVANPNFPIWSPDGTKILYSSSGGATLEAFVANPDGTSPTRLTINSATDVATDWYRQPVQPSAPAMFDFDGDGKTDVSLYRPSNNVWYLLRSTAGFTAYQFGAAGDKMVPADFTGDGKTDVAMYRPSTGTWYILRSEDLTLNVAQFGISTDIPTPGDFDGDGKADMAVYRPDAQGTFYILGTSAGHSVVQFGLAGDKPTTADFDGDGKADVAVYRPSSGVWYRFNSSNGAFWAAQFGAAGDKIVPADYTGDGKTDLAVYRPSTGFWYVLRSENDTAYGAPFGIATDIPAAGDYDGDGKADLAVYRPDAQGLFYILGTSAGFSVVPFGLAGDTPAPSAYVN